MIKNETASKMRFKSTMPPSHREQPLSGPEHAALSSTVRPLLGEASQALVGG